MSSTLNHVTDPDELLSMNQAAKVLGVNRQWLRGYLARDGIKLYRLGKSVGIRRGDLGRIEFPKKEVASPLT